MSQITRESGGSVTIEPTPAEEAHLASVWEVASRFHQRVEEVLEPIGLTHSSYGILSRLGAVGLEADVAGVASGLQLTADEALGIAEELAARGLVRLSARGGSARIWATMLGSARAREGRRRLGVVLHELTESFTPSERAALRRLLSRIRTPERRLA